MIIQTRGQPRRDRIRLIVRHKEGAPGNGGAFAFWSKKRAAVGGQTRGLRARHLLLTDLLTADSPMTKKSAQSWLVKSEPASYSWETFVKDGRAAWTGVRNFQARNNLRAMRKGDLVLFYHSVTGKEVVGFAKVAKEAYADPTATEGDWSCVDLVPVKALKRPVTLEEIKASKPLNNIALVRNSRISVIPLTAEEAEEITRMASA